jgi:hypothetical protein
LDILDISKLNELYLSLLCENEIYWKNINNILWKYLKIDKNESIA